MIGPCAKRRVVCTLVLPFGYKIVAENLCANAQQVCPRAPGEDYRKCTTVCEQPGHAEVQALAHAKRIGCDLHGAAAHIHGHYHACEPCARAIYDAGIRTLTIHSHDVPKGAVIGRGYRRA
jgi:deoxycytidylate deaminase